MTVPPSADSKPTVVPAPRSTTLAALALLGAILGVYAHTLTAPFVFDDRGAILENRSIHQLWPLSVPLSPPPGGTTASGRPLVNLSLAINYAISGTDPWSYHAANVAIHGLAALTLMGVARRTWLRWYRQGSRAAPPSPRDVQQTAVIASFAIALLWAVHPLQTAAVSYVVQRAEALAGLFLLLTLFCFLRGVESAHPWRWFPVALVSCLAGMASKEIVVTAPLLLLLYDRAFVGRSLAEAWKQRRVLYLALTGTWILPAILLFSTHSRGGTVGFGSGMSVWHYLLTQCEALVLYLKLAVWPYPLVFDHGTRVATTLAEVLPQALLVLVLLGAAGAALWRRPSAGFLGAWFFVILAPSSSVVPIASQTIAEHRMYLPLAALVAALVVGAAACLGRRFWVPLLLLAIVAGGLTVRRNQTYRSEIALWTDTAARAPANARAHLNLGSALLDADHPADAAAAYERAIRLHPNAEEFHAALCHAYTRMDRLVEAATEGETAVRLNPAYVDGHVNLAHALLRLGRTDEAIEHCTAARRLQPEADDLRRLLAEALMQRSRDFSRRRAWDLARRDATKALGIAPDVAETSFTWGNVAAATQDLNGAITAYRRALELAPDHVGARNNLANAFLVAGHIDEAIAEYERVVKLLPADESVRANLEQARLIRMERLRPR